MKQIIKKEKHELAIYKNKNEIFIPIGLDGIEIDHKKSNSQIKFRKWLSRAAFTLGSVEALFVGHQFYTNGFSISNMFDLMDAFEISVHLFEFGLIPALFTFSSTIRKRDGFFQQYFRLDDTIFEIKLSLFKRYKFQISDIKSLSIRPNRYNVTYLYVVMKDGSTKKVKWFQSFLLKEMQEVVDALFSEINTKISNNDN